MLKWFGDDIKKNMEAAAGEALTEFGLRCETAAKKRLQPGHGVETGTLRRSIHSAVPGYNWRSDNVEPSDSSPERGGQGTEPVEKNGKLTLELGSGLEYAMAIHQGWEAGYKRPGSKSKRGMRGNFSGYHFLTEAVEEMKPKLPGILEKHAKLKRPRKAAK